VHDLGFEGCARVVVINGERELESDKVCESVMRSFWAN